MRRARNAVDHCSLIGTPITVDIESGPAEAAYEAQQGTGPAQDLRAPKQGYYSFRLSAPSVAAHALTYAGTRTIRFSW